MLDREKSSISAMSGQWSGIPEHTYGLKFKLWTRSKLRPRPFKCKVFRYLHGTFHSLFFAAWLLTFKLSCGVGQLRQEYRRNSSQYDQSATSVAIMGRLSASQFTRGQLNANAISGKALTPGRRALQWICIPSTLPPLGELLLETQPNRHL